MTAISPRPANRSPVVVPPLPRSLGRDSTLRRRGRERLLRVLFNASGERRLPRERELVAALQACDPRDPWWVCEANSRTPLYLLPTREWIAALARFVDRVGARRLLEVAAGDGFLSERLRRVRPGIEVIATDDGSWRRPRARMSARDRREFAGVPFAGVRAGCGVRPIKARAAVERYRPDLVLVAWAPPGLLVERCLRGPCRWLLDLSVDGDVCGNGPATWRFRKELPEGALERRALCRLDACPRETRRTRATLYYGARHPDHGIDRHALIPSGAATRAGSGAKAWPRH